MNIRRKLAGLSVAVLVCGAAPATADVTTAWNDITRQAVAMAVPARPGPSALLDFAAVHVAMHDAIQAYQGRFESYTVPIAGADGSPIAAAAKAARDVLIALLPGPNADSFVESQYQLFLLANTIAVDDPGIQVGQQAAAQLLAMRANDGSHPANPEPFVGGTGPGEWRSTTVPATPMVASWLGAVVPFTLRSSDQLSANQGPPQLHSGLYAKDYDEVKKFGALVNSSRTPEQTDLAHFYSDNAVLYWQRLFISLADAHLDDIGDSARMFALTNMAMADALITSWHDKVRWNFWRPLTAIREGANDGNSRTAGNPAWQSLITTPNYPDYTSGANNLSGAATTMLASFFGTDEMTFSITSVAAAAVQKTRTYDRFSDAAADVVDARILQGIHFRFADAVGRRQGTHSANWAFGHVLRPLE